ncbi:MAG: hypothetical protein IT431_15045 [Phycisphaerales bacterium]|nr:hypothetical protein [Phycisphaerales bacterium]
MQKVKPWQIVLFVLAVGALGFGLYRSFFRQKLDLSDSIVMVDVETGELYRFSIAGRRGVGVPNYNPDSGKLTLLPVTQDEQGVWKITERALRLLGDLEVDAKAVVSRDTGEVSAVGSPKKATPTIPSQG